MDLSFQESLPIFAAVLSTVFLVFLLLSKRDRSDDGYGFGYRPTAGKNRGWISYLWTPLISLEILLFLLHSVYSVPWAKSFSSLLVVSVFFVFVFFADMRFGRMKTRYPLASVMLLHILILMDPPGGFALAERTAAKAKLVQGGFWETGWHLLNTTYDPFPADIGLGSILTILLSNPVTSSLSGFFVRLGLRISFDLVLFSLVRRVTGDKSAGVLAVFLFALTPPTLMSSHPPKWTGVLLSLIPTLMLIRAFEGSTPRWSVAAGILSYMAAVFYHVSTAILIFFPASAVVFAYVADRTLLKDEIWREIYESGLVRTALFLFAAIVFTKAIYTSGYLQQVLPVLKKFFLEAFTERGGSEAYKPAFETARVGFVQGYSWVFSSALGTALLIYGFIKRRTIGGSFTYILYVLGIAFAFFGFLVAYLQAGGFQGAMYPALTFAVPAGAVVGVVCIRRSPLPVGIITLISMFLFAGIALQDPMLFGRKTFERTKVGVFPPNRSEFDQAKFMGKVIPSGSGPALPYEVYTSLEYLNTVENWPNPGIYTHSADHMRLEIDNVITKNELHDFIYVWPERWHPNIESEITRVKIDVYYTGGGFTVFRKSPS